jgi:hypothetical protein
MQQQPLEEVDRYHPGRMIDVTSTNRFEGLLEAGLGRGHGKYIRNQLAHLLGKLAAAVKHANSMAAAQVIAAAIG